MRAQRYVKELARKVLGKCEWYLEVAVVLSQVPCVVVADEMVEHMCKGVPLRADEELMLRRFPAIANKLLAPIPRLDEVLEIIQYQNKNYDGTGSPKGPVKGAAIPLGARLLRIALDFDALVAGGHSWRVAFATMMERTGRYDPTLLDEFATLRELELESIVHELPLSELRHGMIVASDIKNSHGMIVVANGQTITARIIDRLTNFAEVRGPFFVRVPERISQF